MYANFTEETATGTGDVITLSGATSGNIPFSASFSDGDLVAYVIEDGSGVKVSGIGTYSAGTITRNDDWNYNGSVVDKKPSANIALDGNLTVRCTPQASRLPFPSIVNSAQGAIAGQRNIKPYGRTGVEGDKDLSVHEVAVPHMLFLVPSGISINYASFEVRTPSTDPDAVARVGISAIDANGEVSKLLSKSNEIDITTSGNKGASLPPIHFPNETLIFGWLSVKDSVGDLKVQGYDRGHVVTRDRYIPSVHSSNFRNSIHSFLMASDSNADYPSNITPFNYYINHSGWQGVDMILGYED